MSNKTVAYYYDEEVGNYNDVNLMRPHRVRLAHNLIDGYGLQNKMMVHRPERSLNTDMTVFHADGTPLPPPPPALFRHLSRPFHDRQSPPPGAQGLFAKIPLGSLIAFLSHKPDMRLEKRRNSN
jgi:hypothetical protein